MPTATAGDVCTAFMSHRCTRTHRSNSLVLCLAVACCRLLRLSYTGAREDHYRYGPSGSNGSQRFSNVCSMGYRYCKQQRVIFALVLHTSALLRVQGVSKFSKWIYARLYSVCRYVRTYSTSLACAAISFPVKI